MQLLSLISGKYLALLINGYDHDVIPNNEGKFQFDSHEEADDNINYFIESLKKYALEHNYPVSKVNNLRFKIKQIA